MPDLNRVQNQCWRFQANSSIQFYLGKGNHAFGAASASSSDSFSRLRFFHSLPSFTSLGPAPDSSFSPLGPSSDSPLESLRNRSQECINLYPKLVYTECQNKQNFLLHVLCLYFHKSSLSETDKSTFLNSENSNGPKAGRNDFYAKKTFTNVTVQKAKSNGMTTSLFFTKTTFYICIWVQCMQSTRVELFVPNQKIFPRKHTASLRNHYPLDISRLNIGEHPSYCQFPMVILLFSYTNEQKWYGLNSSWVHVLGAERTRNLS